MLHTFTITRTAPQRTLLHFAMEIFAKPKSHGESNIQIPMIPSAQFSITPYILEAQERGVK
jgi:hypothetical protein